MEILRRYLNSLHADVYEFWCRPGSGAQTSPHTFPEQWSRKLSRFLVSPEDLEWRQTKRMSSGPGDNVLNDLCFELGTLDLFGGGVGLFSQQRMFAKTWLQMCSSRQWAKSKSCRNRRRSGVKKSAKISLTTRFIVSNPSSWGLDQDF